MYLIEDGGLTLVDPEFPSSVDRVFKYVTHRLGRELTDIKLVCATHAHLDHIGGLGKVISKTKAKVALPLASRGYIEGRKTYEVTVKEFIVRSLRQRFSKTKKPFSRKQLGEFLSFLASLSRLPSLMDLLTMNIVGFSFFPHRFKVKVDFWLKDGDCLPSNSLWKMISLPGHSSDSVCFYNARMRSLIAGDLIVSIGQKPYLNPIILADRSKALKSLKKLKQLGVDHLYPGCGSPIMKEGILKEIKAD